MKRTALYSSAGRRRDGLPTVVGDLGASMLPSAPPSAPRLKRLLAAYRPQLLVLAAVLAVLSGALLNRYLAVQPAVITQQTIDRAVRASLEKKPLPSQAAKAYEAIRPSVVRVAGFGHPEASGSLPKKGAKTPPQNESDKPGDENTSIGTGVVITEKGAILTNLHVAAGTTRIEVEFADGSKSEAVVTGVDADNDLAVLQAKTLPDDLQAATLITTGDLRPGDEVLAVGYPFGFGPSASTGVVSGLKREFRSTDDRRVLRNLIQFDAAANPGNSGGPLVNMEGEVLGIVTAILNPTQQRFFVGLAFAVPIENAAAAVGVHPF